MGLWLFLPITRYPPWFMGVPALTMDGGFQMASIFITWPTSVPPSVVLEPPYSWIILSTTSRKQILVWCEVSIVRSTEFIETWVLYIVLVVRISFSGQNSTINKTRSCGHTQVKTRLPVRSVLFKHLRALPSIVVGDHTRTEGAAVLFWLMACTSSIT